MGSNYEPASLVGTFWTRKCFPPTLLMATIFIVPSLPPFPAHTYQEELPPAIYAQGAEVRLTSGS